MRYRLFLGCLAVLLGMSLGMYATTRPATALAIQEVRHQVEYVQLVLPEAQPAYVVALAVNSYVVGHVSAAAYGYLHVVERAPLPVSTDSILRTGAGICGEAASAALALYSGLGIEARRLDIWYDLPDGTVATHTTTEVRYEESWHWFDPTWGVFYEGDSVYSFRDVIEMTPEARGAVYVGDDSMLWMRAVRASGVMDGPLAFLDFPSVRVEVGGQVIFERTGTWDSEAAGNIDSGKTLSRVPPVGPITRPRRRSPSCRSERPG